MNIFLFFHFFFHFLGVLNVPLKPITNDILLLFVLFAFSAAKLQKKKYIETNKMWKEKSPLLLQVNFIKTENSSFDFYYTYKKQHLEKLNNIVYFWWFATDLRNMNVRKIWGEPNDRRNGTNVSTFYVVLNDWRTEDTINCIKRFIKA